MPSNPPRPETGRRSSFLSIFLVFLYVVLISLLLLSNCRGCHGDAGREASPLPPSPVPAPMPAPADSTATPPDSVAEDSAAVDEARTIGHQGGLKVTLLWPFPGDIDLHVKQPSGREVFYRQPIDRASGGSLDVDNREGGSGASNAAENIYWTDPPCGRYEISLVYYGPARSSNRMGQGTCKVVVVREGASPQTYDVPMSTLKQREVVTSVTVE